jgi:hypothetical protein
VLITFCNSDAHIPLHLQQTVQQHAAHPIACSLHAAAIRINREQISKIHESNHDEKLAKQMWSDFHISSHNGTHLSAAETRCCPTTKRRKSPFCRQPAAGFFFSFSRIIFYISCTIVIAIINDVYFVLP